MFESSVSTPGINRGRGDREFTAGAFCDMNPGSKALDFGFFPKLQEISSYLAGKPWEEDRHFARLYRIRTSGLGWRLEGLLERL